MKSRIMLASIFIFTFIKLFLLGSSDVISQTDGINWSVNQISDKGEISENPAIASDHNGGVHIFWSQSVNDTTTPTLFYCYKKGNVSKTIDILIGKLPPLQRLWMIGESFILYMFKMVLFGIQKRGLK